MEKLLTTKDLADAIGVSESSLRRWTNNGVIKMSRTVGGHRRIPQSEAIRFIRESHATVLRPECLGLPALAGAAAAIHSDGQSLDDDAVFQALVDGEAESTKGMIVTQYLKGHGLASLFDGPIARAMHRIGELWADEPGSLLIEHRATDICLAAIHKLRDLLPAPSTNAMLAIGGAPQGDCYLLPSLMAATVINEAGYRTINFGPETPVSAITAAVDKFQAAFVWLSVSLIEQKSQLQHEIEELSARLQERNIPLLLGGRLSNELNVHAFQSVYIMQSMTEVSAFVRSARRLAAGMNAKSIRSSGPA